MKILKPAQAGKSKILCTLGPSSNDDHTILTLIESGMDVARINFSHGTAQEKKDTFKQLDRIAPQLAILCDIQGPKIRIGNMKKELDGSWIQAGDTFTLTSRQIEGTTKEVSVSHKELTMEVRTGELIFINDGIICLKVTSVEAEDIHCKVVAGGRLFSKKGLNLPDTELSLRVPTGKDIEDLKLIAELNPAYLAASFVSSADDIHTIRQILSSYGNDDIKIIAKIERPVAVQNYESILNVSDGIMVARGDLGVELNAEDVPPLQKQMVTKANIMGKPIIVATQMLESMITNSIPTRAEVSDIYNAISDGADCVMLSAETASGKYPVQAVEAMERISRNSVTHFPHRNPDHFDSQEITIAEIMGHLVASTCGLLKSKGYHYGKILCLTKSGFSARMISKYRPELPIIAVTHCERTAKELQLLWGVTPILCPTLESSHISTERVKLAIQTCVENHTIRRQEKLVVTGDFFNLPHHTNMVTVITAQDIFEEEG